MWETVWHIIEHTLIDSLKMLPFLFVAYLLIEMLEHKASDKLQHALSRSGNFGIVVGALLGCVPQCRLLGCGCQLLFGADYYTGNDDVSVSCDVRRGGAHAAVSTRQGRYDFSADPD